MAPAFFALVIFRVGSHIYVWASLDYGYPIHSSCIAGMTGMYHHTQLFIG
jgi:hypothetical protein